MFRWTVIIVTASVLAIGVGCRGPEEPTLLAGMGDAVITPPEGSKLDGYSREPSAGVRHDLHARTLAIEDRDGNAVMLISLELFTLERALLKRIRDEIAEHTGIPEDAILISCSHTYSGPDVAAAGEDYRNTLVERVVTSASGAWKDRLPARIGTGTAMATEIGRDSRRLPYGGMHPDPEVGIIRIDSPRGDVRGIAFFYGCAPSAFERDNREITGDWPSYAADGIRDHFGAECWTAFFQGADGDITVGFDESFDQAGVDLPIRGASYAALKGNDMAWTVIEAAYRIEPSPDLTVAVTVDYFNYPRAGAARITLKRAEFLRDIALARLAEIEEDRRGKPDPLARDNARAAVLAAEYTIERVRRGVANPAPDPLTVRQQAIRIGDAGIVSLPTETFSEIGLAIKQRSPFARTFLASMTDGIIDPMTTEEAYDRDDPDALRTRFDRRCAVVSVAAASTLMDRLHTP